MYYERQPYGVCDRETSESTRDKKEPPYIIYEMKENEKKKKKNLKLTTLFKGIPHIYAATHRRPLVQL